MLPASPRPLGYRRAPHLTTSAGRGIYTRGSEDVQEIAFVNGQFMALSEARISINDRGFIFGDGVYEVVRGYHGRLFALERHWRRLRRSLAELSIDGVDLAALHRLVLEAVARAGTETPLVYVQITRGIAPRSHSWRSDQIVPSVIITVRETPPANERQRTDGVACVTTPDIRWGRCDIKSLNLLPNVMAKQLAHQKGAHEAIFVTAAGVVTEGSSSAVGIVQHGRLRFHPLGPAILPGITRELVVEQATARGLEVVEEAFDLPTLLAADEVFLAGTGCEVTGVVSVDGRRLGTGRLGRVTRQLIEAYEGSLARGEDQPRD